MFFLKTQEGHMPFFLKKYSSYRASNCIEIFLTVKLESTKWSRIFTKMRTKRVKTCVLKKFNTTRVLGQASFF